MVKMRFIFLGSVLLHGLLAFSIRQYVTNSKNFAAKSFSSIEWVSSSAKPKDLKKISVSENNTPSANFSNEKNILESVVEDYPVTEIPEEVVYNPPPIYPNKARREGLEGAFLVKIFVNEDGAVESVEIGALEGRREIFEESIMTALKTWKFKAKNKKISFEVPISFQLDQ